MHIDRVFDARLDKINALPVGGLFLLESSSQVCPHVKLKGNKAISAVHHLEPNADEYEPWCTRTAQLGTLRVVMLDEDTQDRLRALIAIDPDLARALVKEIVDAHSTD